MSRRVLVVGLVVVLAAAIGFATSAPSTGPASWSAAVELSMPASHAQQSQIAIDARGGTVAVWSRPRGGTAVIQAAVRPPGQRWHAPVDLIAPGADSSTDPQVAVDARGDAFALWERFHHGEYVVQAAVRPVGGAWRRAATLSAVSTRSTAPRIAVDRRGNAVAVWIGFVRGLSVVHASARPAGGAWQRPVDLVRMRSPGWRTFTGVEVAVDAKGGAVAAWTRSGESPARRRKPRPGHVEASVRRNGRWSAPTKLSADGTIGCCTDVAVDPRGNAVVVWSLAPSLDAFVSVVQSAAMSRGRWAAPVSLTPKGELASDTQVVVDDRGNATAIWNRSDLQGASSVVSAARPAGATWQAPVDVSAPGERASEADLAVNARGDAVAVWFRYLAFHEDVEQTDGVVRSARRAAGGTWQAPVDVSAVGFPEGPGHVAVDARGGAVAIWERLVGSHVRVLAADLPG